MSIELSPEAERAASEINVQPNVAVEIDGIDGVFSAVSVNRYIRIGDPGLVIGPGWKIGGYTALEDNNPLLQIGQGGTTTRISNGIAPDRGQASGVARMVVSMIDKDEQVSRLLAPAIEIDDLLGRKVKVRFGFKNVPYPSGYITVFRGVIEDYQSGAGYVTLAFNHIEDRKRRSLFTRLSSKLTLGIDAITTANLQVSDPALFPVQYTGGPTGVDNSLSYFCRIDDEILKYTGVSGGQLTGIIRAQLGTQPAAHDADAEVYPLYRFQGNALDLALKLQLSGKNGPYRTGVTFKNFVRLNDGSEVANALFFDREDADDLYGLTAGTYVTVSGAGIGGNNFTDKQISEVVKVADGTYVVLSGVSLSVELNTPAVASFRSQYDTLGVGIGLDQEDVDVAQYETIRDRYLASFPIDITVDAIEDAKTFIDTELFKNSACFSVPRLGRSSVVFHAPPLSNSKLAKLDRTNIKSPADIKIRRSTSAHFANTIIYEVDFDVIEGKFKKNYEYTPTTQPPSMTRVGSKPLKFSSRGLRSDNGAALATANAANRMLARYQAGAAYFENLKILYGVGYSLQIGDVLMLDTEGLHITNLDTGDRSAKKTLVEVNNWGLDLASGEVTVTLVNTAFGLEKRYASWAPASQVGLNSTTTRINLKKSYGTKSYQFEAKKWRNYVGEKIRVRSYDFTQVAEVTLASVYEADASSITVSPALPWVPAEDFMVEPATYRPLATDGQAFKLNHIFWSPTVLVASGISGTQFTVAPGDVGKFFIGSQVKIHNDDYSINSIEAEVTNISGVTITLNTTLGFTPAAGQKIELIGFADEGPAYRWT